MVVGIEKFKEAFVDFIDNYVIIGGTACDIVLRDTNMRPRATDDIDLILIVENMTPEFGTAFWNFIKNGEYSNSQRKRGEDKAPAYEMYRFENPKDGYPVKIELLSRHSYLLGEPTGFHIEPIPFEEEVSSLSAIMMDDDFYELTIQNSFVEDGLRIASPAALICLKSKAYLNLLSEKEQGRKVNSKDIKKHRTDVLKLIATASFPEPIVVPATVMTCIDQYATAITEMLPSQSLEDALDRKSDDIAAFIEALKNSFISRKP
jgi:hypothetical protein